MGKKRSVRTILAVLLLIISLAVLCWGVVPLGEESREVPISPGELVLPSPEAGWFSDQQMA